MAHPPVGSATTPAPTRTSPTSSGHADQVESSRRLGPGGGRGVGVQSGEGGPDWTADLSSTDLRALMVSLPVIEQAKGMLMVYYGVNDRTAFEVLRRWSSHRNLKLNTLCLEIVTAGSRRHPDPYGALHEHLQAQPGSARVV